MTRPESRNPFENVLTPEELTSLATGLGIEDDDPIVTALSYENGLVPDLREFSDTGSRKHILDRGKLALESWQKEKKTDPRLSVLDPEHAAWVIRNALSEEADYMRETRARVDRISAIRKVLELT